MSVTCRCHPTQPRTSYSSSPQSLFASSNRSSMAQPYCLRRWRWGGPVGRQAAAFPVAPQQFVQPQAVPAMPSAASNPNARATTDPEVQALRREVEALRASQERMAALLSSVADRLPPRPKQP